MKKELLKIKHENHVLAETVIDHKFYFYKEDYSELGEVNGVVETCYNKYLTAKTRLGEITNYENDGMSIDITLTDERKIAKVEVKGMNITKNEEKVKQKLKSRFRY